MCKSHWALLKNTKQVITHAIMNRKCWIDCNQTLLGGVHDAQHFDEIVLNGSCRGEGSNFGLCIDMCHHTYNTLALRHKRVIAVWLNCYIHGQSAQAFRDNGTPAAAMHSIM